jgi:hypothetical protein
MPNFALVRTESKFQNFELGNGESFKIQYRSHLLLSNMNLNFFSVQNLAEIFHTLTECQIFLSFRLIENFKIFNFSMAKVAKFSIAVTYCWVTQTWFFSVQNLAEIFHTLTECQIFLTFGLIENFKIFNFSMAKVSKFSIAVTYCWVTWTWIFFLS